MHSIYLITNKLDGKIYVGQTCETVHRRWTRHLSQCKDPNSQTHFHRALKLYGEENFKIETLICAIDRNWANKLEKLLIRVLKANNHKVGYNSAEGGDTNAGYKRSPEATAKTTAFNLGSKRSPESRKRMSEWQIGKKLSEEHKEKLRQANLGSHRSPEQKANMIKAQRLRREKAKADSGSNNS